MTMYAIARVSKIKGMKHLQSASAHNTRKMHVSNADPSGVTLVLAGSNDPAADVIKRLPTDENGEIKVRKNGVWAMEHMLTASPEYFRPSDPSNAGTYDKKRMDAWRVRTISWLHDRYGDNLASAILHLDEATPHIQAFVVPRRSDGKLDAASLFGPEQLRDLQTSYADALKELGLQRGIESSKAKHQTIKRYYALVNAPVVQDAPRITTTRPPEMPRKAISESVWGSDAYKARKASEAAHDAQIAKRRAEVRAHNEAVLDAAPALAAKAKLYDATVKANASRNAAVDRLREQAARVRDIPLEHVFTMFDSRTDKRDKKNYDTCAGRISVNGTKFFNHDANIGGGGAIDLTMHLGAMDYKSAVALLSGEFGRDAALSAALAKTHDEALEAVQSVQSEAQSKIPAQSLDPSHIAAVRAYLINERAISSHVVDMLIERGKIFAVAVGKYINAAFRLGNNEGEGVELRGISGTYHGVRGKKQMFSITMKGATKSVFVESAIEAMSYYTLARERGERVRVVSTTGSSSERLKTAVQQELDAGRTVVLAFNADGKGPNKTVIDDDRVCVEKPPHGVNDWNDWLRDKTSILAEIEANELSRRDDQSLSM